jgi:hypothetical protein
MNADEVSLAMRKMRGTDPLSTALRTVAFPITKQDLIARLGDATLEVAGTRAPISTIVRGVPDARFADAGQAQRAVNFRLEGIAKALRAVDEAERALK